MSSRSPRAFVYINDVPAPGLLESSVDNNNYAQADTFRCRFSLKGLAQGLIKNADALGASNTRALVAGTIDDLLQLDPLTVRVGYSDDYPQNQFKQFIIGNVDDLHYDPLSNTIELSGRDYTSHFIDNKTTEKWPNKSAAQIVTALAAKYGLTPVVGAATSVKVGTYLNSYQAQMGDAKSEWDLLCFLAQVTLDDAGNSFVVYVSGMELHFEPRPQVGNYELVCAAPSDFSESPVFAGVHLQFSRNLTVLRNVVVTVQSTQIGKKAPITVSYPSAAKSIAAGASSTRKQNYVYRLTPGLTKEQCLQRAQALHQDITRHEVNMSANMPADQLLLPNMMVQVSGTGTLFDQGYFPASVRRQMSVNGGYTMSFDAKNRATESQVTL